MGKGAEMVGFVSCFGLLQGIMRVLKGQIFHSSVLLVALALGVGVKRCFLHS